MNIIDEEDLAQKSLCGIPVFLNDVCAIYPATLREIANLGYTVFLQYLHLLLLQKPVDASDTWSQIAKELSDYQYFILLVEVDAELNQAVRSAFHFFIHENISFSVEPPQIIVGEPIDKRIITEELFYEFRRILKKMYWVEAGEQDITIQASDDERTRTLKETMRKNRMKIAKSKQKKNNQDSSNIGFSDLIASLTLGNCGLNIKNVWDITYYACQDQLKRMGWRDKFDINNRAAMAGAKIKKEDLTSWIKSINSTN